MRIALITREFPPETDWGGIGRFYAVFAEALAGQGHEIEVFTQGLASDRIERAGPILVHRVVPRLWLVGPRRGGDLGGVGVRYIGFFALTLAVAMAARVALRHRAKPFDLVEGHEHLGINALANIYGRGRFATLSRYHTTYHSLVSRGLVDWPASALIRWLERFSIRSADGRTAASEHIERMTREDFPGTPPSDDVIPLLSNFDASIRNPPVAEREKLIVFVGRMVSGHKNPELAARAFVELSSQFPDWRIEFAGADMPADGGVTTWQACERILSHCPGRYRYHGTLEQAGVQELYRRARLILIPSRFESFGLVALEAMVAGTVPVVADRTALPEVVGSAGVVFANESLTDLREKLAQIMSDESRQAALSAAGPARVAQEFSSQKLLQRNISLFEELISRREIP